MNDNKNVLNRTRCYLAGAMQYTPDGKTWRDLVKDQLKDRNIIFLDPYYKPFVNDVPEDDESRKEMLHWVETSQFDLIEQRMRRVRAYDLRCIDISDFIIVNINPKIPTWGTTEEITLAVKQQKPVFVIIDHERGKRACPLWLFGTFPHKYIYDSTQDAIDMIKAIDDGIVPVNSDKWKLLHPQYR